VSAATTATPEQLAALTLPATLPGVVRVGTPIRATMPDGETLDGVVIRQRGDVWAVGVSANDLHHVFPSTTLRDNHAVDLTDATGRAHVAWALSSRVWSSGADVSASMRLGAELLSFDGPLVPWPRLVSASPLHGDGGGTGWAACVEHLEPSDDTRLPDGSRWVDAEALRLVALHVLGGGS